MHFTNSMQVQQDKRPLTAEELLALGMKRLPVSQRAPRRPRLMLD
jgi:hypothetical protein